MVSEPATGSAQVVIFRWFADRTIGSTAMLGHWSLEGAVSGARPGSRVQKVANIVFGKAEAADPFLDKAIL